jgi:hypothetical protein
MRTVFLLLLFANAVFFAYRYYVTQYPSVGADPAGQQLQPERIRLVPPEELARLAVSRRGGACIELGPLAAADAARAEESVATLAGGLKVAQRRSDEAARWWVYIAPLPTRVAAVQRAAELKKLGVDDSLVINDDPQWRNAISLGVFRTEDAANTRADALRKRGVRGAQVAPRDGAGARVFVQLRDAPEPVRLRFVELKGGFPGSDVNECPG